MMQYQNAGGWRFGERPTSVEALYTPQATNNDFLRKVAALAQDPSKQGLLDQSLSATPLSGLLDAPGAETPGSGGWGNDGGIGSPQSRGNGSSYNTNAPAMPSAVPAMLSAAGLGFLAPFASTAYNAVARNGFDPTKGAITDPSLQFDTPAWASAVNANAAARAARQNGAGMGDYGGMFGDVSFGDGNDAGMGGMSAADAGIGGAGPSMGNEAGLGFGGDYGGGYGFGGLGDW